MPHFGQSAEINNYVKKLLVFFHGGYLWLDNPISVDIELIATIIGLPVVGMNPTPFLRKYQETMISVRMKEKYDVIRDKRGFLISSINDHTVCFAAKVLASKMLHKM